MRAVAEHISPHLIPSKNWAVGYNPVHRAIDAGLIDAYQRNGRYTLMPPAFRPEIDGAILKEISR